MYQTTLFEYFKHALSVARTYYLCLFIPFLLGIGCFGEPSPGDVATLGPRGFEDASEADVGLSQGRWAKSGRIGHDQSCGVEDHHILCDSRGHRSICEVR